MRNEPPKNNRLKTSYVLINITSHLPWSLGGSPPCNAFAPMEDYSTPIIIRQSVFPAQPDTGKPMSLSTPLPNGTCRASGGLQGGFPAEMPQSWEKGCSKCTLLEYPLVIINLFRLLFPWWKRKAVCLCGLLWLLCNNTTLIFHACIR